MIGLPVDGLYTNGKSRRWRNGAEHGQCYSAGSAGAIMSSVTAFATNRPFCVTINGVPVRAAISLARCAARIKAAGAARISASLRWETGVGAMAFKYFLLLPEVAKLRRYCQTATMN
jgi:hypothetical protein